MTKPALGTLGAMGWSACGAGLMLAAANIHVAHQVFAAGGGVDPELAGQAAALLIGVVWLVATRTPLAGLALTALSLWVAWGMAPVIAQVLTGPVEELPIWLGPIELVAFLFFPLAFFTWRGLVRASAGAAACEEAAGGDAE